MRYIKAKTLLGPTNTINIYKGCSHGCIYCDSRSTCYNFDDFDNIAIKENALQLLEEELKRKGPIMVKMSSMCDPYMHIEESLSLTREALKIINRYDCGVNILTKSDLVLRDLDLLMEINKKTKAVVCMTITTYDDELCQLIETKAPVTSKRFAALKTLQENGIETGIWLCPILPFINDTTQNIIDILNKAHKIAVSYIVNFGFGTTMRSGSREYFYQALDQNFPFLKDRYKLFFKNDYSCPSPNSDKLWALFTELCQKYHFKYNLSEIDKEIDKKMEENIEKNTPTLFDFEVK